MSNHDIETTTRELQELKRMKEELESEMTVRNTDDLTAGAYRIKWTTYQSSRFDSTRFKKDHAELAAAYTKTTTARRFSIN